MKDIWWYYFDPVTYKIVANKVHHGTTYSLITNDEFTSYKDLIWNSKRTSYMFDKAGTKLYMRAKYEYTYFTH